MIRSTRAAGTAAAMLIAAFGTVYAGPSRAWEFNTPPVISPEMGVPVAPLDGADPMLPTQIVAPPAAAADVPAADAPVADAPIASLPAGAATAKVEAATRLSLTQLVRNHATPRTSGAEHECLANAVYFESKGEPLQGQLSVAEVILNRARSGRFPSSLCAVVKQKGQFSFVRGGRLPSVPRSSVAWHKAVAIAHIALQDLADSPAPKALFFNAKGVSPSWRGLRRVASVGYHIFYR